MGPTRCQEFGTATGGRRLTRTSIQLGVDAGQVKKIRKKSLPGGDNLTLGRVSSIGRVTGCDSRDTGPWNSNHDHARGATAALSWHQAVLNRKFTW